MSIVCDGWNFNGVIYDGECSLRFIYRPMLAHERRQFKEMFDGWSCDLSLPEIDAWLARHVVAWGNTPRFEELHESVPELGRRLWKVIAGVAAPDEPNGLGSQWEQESMADLEQVVAGAYRPIQFPAGPYTARNRQAWHHFRTCEAIGVFPDDQIVARNAVVIRNVRGQNRGRRVGLGRPAQRRVAGGKRPPDPDIWFAFGDGEF